MSDVLPTDDTRGIRGQSYGAVMQERFVNYAVSVIVNRALPDVRDGLKPVHRRILFAMQEAGYTAGKSHIKCARIVGDTMGKYHPHGDAAIYDTMVRLAQPWKQRMVLIDGQGNFGSIDDDPPAAPRYTEGKLTRLGMEITGDVGKPENGIVEFRPNYDGREQEPVVLPAGFPNILVNGSAGIAVGMATNIPTHNLGEAIDAAVLVLDDPSATVADVMAVMPGPDFPTSGTIMGRAKIRECYETGRGSLVVVGRAEVVEEKEGRGPPKRKIVIRELPYDVNKAKLEVKINELMDEKLIEGISKTSDESEGESAGGMRLILELKADAQPEFIITKLRKLTPFQTSISYNSNVLDSRGFPRVMNVAEMLREFVEFRRDIVGRRTRKDLDRVRDQQVKQIAFYAAVGRIDEVVLAIRTSADREEAQARLGAMDFDVDDELATLIREADPDARPGATMRLSPVQTDSVLNLSLASLTGLAREDIAGELRNLAKRIRGYIDITEEPGALDRVVREELLAIKAKYPSPRMTEIMETEADEIGQEDLIERKDIVVTLTRGGYVKRTELATFRAQRRGGKGRSGMETRDEDVVIEARICTTRTPLLVFTAKGQVHALKAWRLPDAAPNAKGRPIVNFLELRDGDQVTAIVPLAEDREATVDRNLVFVTESGSVRRNRISDFMDIRKGGKSAMALEQDGVAVDRLIAVLPADDGDDMFIATSTGMCNRFPLEDLRVFQSRQSTGVRGIQFKRDGDRVVDAAILPNVTLTPLERDVYLAGGSRTVLDKDLQNEAGARTPQPDSLSFTPHEGPVDDDAPARVVVTLSPERMEELRRTEGFLLTVTANGYGKRSSTHEYRSTSRGTSGMAAATLTDQTGPMVSCVLAGDDDQLVLITDGGQTIRQPVQGISILGRTARGVRLLSLADGQAIASVAVAPTPERPGEGEAAPEVADEAVPDAA